MSAEKEVVISCEQLSYQSGKKMLLNQINLQIKKGEHWLLYGENGSGKTTLLSIFAACKRQSKGVLKLWGEELTEDNVLEYKKRIGFVSSSFFDAKYHAEKVLDIVLAARQGSYGVDYCQVTAPEVRLAKKLLTKLGLEDKIESEYERLSKGQRQNVLIARALMNDVDILLLDEPSSGLDVLAKERFKMLLQRLMAKKDLTIIYVTHDINEAQGFFEQVILLRCGNIIKKGRPEEIFEEKTMSTFFQVPIKIDTKQNISFALKRFEQA